MSPAGRPSSSVASAPVLALRLLLVAAAYYLSGRLGLLLAIPPGYATAVWPASGIALAAVLLWGHRVAPGVWVGSFAVNVGTSLDTSSALALLSSLSLPAFIALGASLHAVVGAWLIRRFVGYRNVLEQELEIVSILLLGGPIACLVSASVGISALYFHGLIPPENLLFNWWTWWVGDSIGVLIFAPLALAWSLRPWSVWKGRQVQVTLPLIALFAGVVWMFIHTSGREQARVQTEFDGWSRAIGIQLQNEMEKRFDALNSLQAFYAGSEQVTPAEFEVFAGRLLADRPGTLGFSWNPVIDGAQRDDFEARMRRDGATGYRIRELDSGGELRPAATRPLYVPVAYMVPEAMNRRVLGFDVVSEPRRASAAWRARDTGVAVATAPTLLVQELEDALSMLVFAPVYRSAAPEDSVEWRRQNFRGVVTAAFRLPNFIPAVLAGNKAAEVDVAIYDVSDATPKLVYRNRGDVALTPGLTQSQELPVAGRRWRVDYSLSGEYLVAHRSWQAWSLLAAGMLFTGLLGMFLLVAIGRGSRVERLVDERTAQLREANRNLAREAARSERFETEARARVEQIAATNRELDQFASVVSHDLQAPLRNIHSFASLIEKRHGATLADEAKEYLAYLRGSATDMGRLIDDLLQLSRVNPKRANMEPTRAGDALTAALANLRADIEACGAQVEQAELPEIFGDAGLLTQLFQNLIANAIKFQRPGVPARVRVAAELIRGEWRFAIADNGIGIAEKHIGRLFQMFRRLHTAEAYPGTGIGLALCKKIVGLHGGRIWLESKQGEGTTVFFALPLQVPATRADGVAA